MSDDNQKKNYLVTLRTIQLLESPIQGNFDIAHLKAINYHLFQDIKSEKYQAGNFRSAVPDGTVEWTKTRKLSSIESKTLVVYSRMDQESLNSLNEKLSPENLVNLKTSKNTKEFAKNIANLYADLDYIHPFIDGNSRTLRVFTELLARENGHKIEWSKFNINDIGRDILYIARDLSVGERALQHVKSDEMKRAILYTQDTFSQNKSLTTLLPEVIRPTRAYDFEHLNKKDAITRHPELKEAYLTLDLARTYIEKKNPSNYTY